MDTRGRLHLRAEDREYLDLHGGDLLEVTIRKVTLPPKDEKSKV
jgi:bifunctional DNA-binding transcriptional regulator/antitoxin component of YhaV-PrlF toxin-antitoxin module